VRVLVACEFSGAVRDAFHERGHQVYSVDLLPGEGVYADWHLETDIMDLPMTDWDLMIAFPPCTHLAVSGARWFKDKQKEQAMAIKFVEWLWNVPIPRIAIENPIGVLSTLSSLGKPTQIVQPYWFGDPFKKTTCLWLKNLPLLTATQVVDEGEIHVTKSGRRLPKWYNLPPSPDRGKLRSKTFPGIARAMADQWGNLT
jgi:site-specific DNA-cytosine methylase